MFCALCAFEKALKTRQYFARFALLKKRSKHVNILRALRF